MLLLHLGSDHVQMIDNTGTTNIPRFHIEELLPQKILNWTISNPSDTTIAVIQGPGSFTNIRVGTLVCNLLASTHPDKFTFLSTDKLALFQAIHRTGTLPVQGAVFMGHMKNFWLYNCETKEHTLTPKVDYTAPAKDFFIDQMSEQFWIEKRENMIQFGVQNDNITLTYLNTNHSATPQELGFTEGKNITPTYILNPEITPPKKK